jgi:two-component system nitrogen regulation response regulator GlnG
MNAQAQKILVADDDLPSRLFLSQTFTSLGYQVRATNSAAALLKWIGEGEGHLVIADMAMSDNAGLNIVASIRKRQPDLSVIVTSPHNTLVSAVTAAEHGAHDYIAKPFDLEVLIESVRRALARPSGPPRASARAIRDEQLPMIGRSPPMQDLYRSIAKLVGTDLGVLILGETGAGKQSVARALHDLGRRRAGLFVSVSLAAAWPGSLDRELFGDGNGGTGKLAEADGGTLYLDDIGDAPMETQAWLLGVLGRLERAPGAGGQSGPNVRLLAATNRDLAALVREGLFREDLYFRLDVASLRVPPLRDRTEDIPDLVAAFLLRSNREGLPAKAIDAVALERLKSHAWPGNVRELQNLIRRICVLHPDYTITPGMLERNLVALTDAPPANDGQLSLSTVVEQRLAIYFDEEANGALPEDFYNHVLHGVERPLLQLTLAASRGNQGRAAKMLGINRNTLRKKIEVLGVPPFRAGRPSLAGTDTAAVEGG